MAMLKFLTIAIGAVLLVGLILRLTHPLPPLEPRELSEALADTEDTLLGRETAALEGRHPGLNGVRLLEDAHEAFAARILMARAAEKSLDLQYYIWHPDTAGTLLLAELMKAADRGVRVRLLMDDNGTHGLDAALAALDAHPNAQVRLFNPFVIRKPKLVGYIMDFSRLNRRMHNKAMVVDNRIAVVGGRNIGDEYMGAKAGDLFADLDAFVIGPAVRDVSADFDRYWASESAYPAAVILPPLSAAQQADMERQAKAASSRPIAAAYLEAVEDSVIANGLADGSIPLEWVPVTLVSDDPSKGLGEAKRSELLAVRLGKILGEPESDVALVSAYFVPTEDGAEAFAALARDGKSVKIMTNSLKANDVALVHTGYAPHRLELLRAGVRLWEMKGEDSEKAKLRFNPSGSGGGTVFRSSGSSLHAKTFAVDRQRLFVGSFNFDPRSARLNSELGFVIDSPKMAARLHDMFETGIAEAAYEVRLAADGKRLEWHEATDNGVIVHQTEPGTTGFQRALVRALSLLPLDWML